MATSHQMEAARQDQAALRRVLELHARDGSESLAAEGIAIDLEVLQCQRMLTLVELESLQSLTRSQSLHKERGGSEQTNFKLMLRFDTDQSFRKVIHMVNFTHIDSVIRKSMEGVCTLLRRYRAANERPESLIQDLLVDLNEFAKNLQSVAPQSDCPWTGEAQALAQELKTLSAENPQFKPAYVDGIARILQSLKPTR